MPLIYGLGPLASERVSIHSVGRLLERHGIRLTDADVWQIVLDITETACGEKAGAVLLRRQSRTSFDQPHRREMWMVKIQRQWVRLVWQPETACVVTVLGGPPGQPEMEN